MKNLIFLDHIYHQKTHSSDFFINILKERYEVDIVYYDPYNDMACLSDHLPKKQYDVLVLWQILLEREYVDSHYSYKIGVIIPMYDDYVFRIHSNWYQFLDYKALCFSNNLYKSMCDRGFDAKYVKYFIKPQVVKEKGALDSGFFWQRISSLGVNTIEQLIEGTCIKRLHIHKALDPNHFTIDNSESSVEKSYSEWFENEEDMIACMNESSVYFAPRYFEGIGMSFLTAMAHGRCVIAHDSPTMNEYIQDGYNGLLWSEKHKLSITPERIRHIQDNAIRYMFEGYEEWEESIEGILEWIEENSELKMGLLIKQCDYVGEELKFQYMKAEKYEQYFDCLYKLALNKPSFSKCLENYGVKHVAIYGAGRFCDILISDIESNSSIVLDYLVDRSVDSYNGYRVYKLDDELPYTELIIVTTFLEVDYIRDNIHCPNGVKIVGLNELVLDIYDYNEMNK